jgi:16S rRNA (uracil1498-N3)-methyltransferase
MRITRVYTPDTLTVDHTIVLSAMPSAHLIKVLRLRAGAKAVLFNGDGADYVCEILHAKAEAASLRVVQAQPACAESPAKITLVQAVCRGDKMDWVLEKATELGVVQIIPVISERAEVHLDAERAAKRREHWQRVVISACEQSGRATVPDVSALQPLDQRLSLGVTAEIKLTLEPNGSGITLARDASSIAIAVGPEGGWSERDLAQLALAGFRQVSLGARILRTETAGIAAVSVIQAQCGDFLTSTPNR